MDEVALASDNFDSEAIEDRLTKRIFWSLLLLHVVLWTAAPTISQSNASLDVVEMTLWGHEWQWGYYKHPPLPAWICESCVALFGPVLWPQLLVAQLIIATCFWAVWRLAREFLSPWPALASAMLLEACHYYQYSTVDLNNNAPTKACWALAVLFAYWAITRNLRRDWIGLGVVLGLGMITKYDTALLAITILGFSAIHPKARPLWRTAGPCLTLLAAGAIFLPHVVWLIQHDFLTIQYIQSRSAGSSPSWSNHLAYPLKFVTSQALSLLGVFALCIPLLGMRWRLRSGDQEYRFHRTFLLAMVLGPPLIAIVASVITGARLRSAWGAAMFAYAGLLLLVLFEHVANAQKFRRVAFASAAIGGVCAGALMLLNLAGPYLREHGSRVHYPGRALAQQVQLRWGEVSDRPLEFVGGDWWEAGNVGMYSPARPTTYINLSPEYAPWTSDAELKQHGGVILWEIANETDEIRPQWSARFPNLKISEPIELAWDTGANLPPLRVGMAIVPQSQDDASGDTHRTAASRLSQRPQQPSPSSREARR